MNQRRKPRAKRANGQGSVYQRADGLWVGAAYVLMPDGTAKRRPVYAKSEELVSEKLRAMQARSDQGIPAEATSWTVEAFLNHWLANIVEPSRKPKTYQGYEGIVRMHLIPFIGHRKLHKLTGADVRRMMQQLRSSCLCCRQRVDARRDSPRCCAAGECCDRRPSPRLVQQVHSVLRNALQAAVREELLQRNVAKLVQVSGVTYEVNRGVDTTQAKRLLDSAKEDRLEALYVLALYLGLRRGELLGLMWEDVDLEQKVLTVRRNLQRVGGQLRAVTPKTMRSRRTIPLIDLCVTALREHKERQDRERTAAGEKWSESSYVFATVRGTAIEPDNIRRSWYPLREAAGLDGMRFHDLRHSCVTLLLGLKVPPHIVRDIVGHTNLDVTMSIYAHVSLDDKRAALESLERHLN